LNLRAALVAERLTGRPQEPGYVSKDMERGIVMEPVARRAYEALTGLLVRESGFLAHDGMPIGCSLDGHLGDFQHLVSFKCPKTATHLRYLDAGSVPDEYEPQMLHELWVTGAECYTFVSYDDRLPAPLDLFHVTVSRADVRVPLTLYADKASQFLADVDAYVARLKAR
jgi:hypothetical protein